MKQRHNQNLLIRIFEVACYIFILSPTALLYMFYIHIKQMLLLYNSGKHDG